MCIRDRFKKDKINKLVLTGGEPTLHPNFIEIAEYAMKNISKVTICTNGVIKNKKLRKKVIDLNFATYTISIDSHINKVHNKFRGNKDAFQNVIGFVDELKKKKKNLSIHITLHDSNIDHIGETIDFCKKYDCEIVVGSIYYDKLNYSKQREKEYKNEIDKFKEKYKYNKDIIIVGFDKYCKYRNCPDQNKIFMVDRRGHLVNCYWKKDGGKLIRKY